MLSHYMLSLILFVLFSGSSDAALLLCVGISIGIMSSFVANQTKVNKVKAELKETESLVKDSEDQLKPNDDLHDGEKQCEEKTAENSESISEIEAELEAELEMLQINMNSSNIETQPSDVFEVSFILLLMLVPSLSILH